MKNKLLITSIFFVLILMLSVSAFSLVELVRTVDINECNDGVWNGEEEGVDCGGSCRTDCCENDYFDKNLGECDIDRGPDCSYGCDWEKTNGPHGGKTLSIAIDYIDTDILYTAIYPLTDNDFYPYDGGVYKSFDAGETWEDYSKGIGNKEIWSVTIDLNDNSILYAGAVDGEIYKSEDAGENWEEVKGEEDRFETIFWVEVDPEDSNVVIAGSRYGNIYRTDDAGETWTTISDSEGLDTGGAISSVHFSPHDSNIVFATSGFMDVWDLDSRHGVFRSLDNGLTWEAVDDDLEGNVNFGDTAFDPDDENIVYAVNGLIGTEEGGVYRSEDAGETWENIWGDNVDEEKFSSIEVYSEDSSIIYVAGEGMYVWKSIDGGETWETINSNELSVMNYDNGGSFITALYLDQSDSDRLFVASYASGNYRTLDGGETWEEINDQINFAYTLALAPDYSESNGIVTSSFTDGLHKTTTDSLDWERVLNEGLGINGFTRIFTIPLDSDLVYGTGRFKLEDNELEVAEFRISYDGGEIWEVIEIELDSPTFVRAFLDPTRNPIIKDGVDVFSTGEELVETSYAYVIWVAIDPEDENVAYAASQNAGIFKTEDKGQTWTAKNSGFGSNRDFRSVVVDSDGRVYAAAVGEDPEVYYSDDEGDSWSKLNDDLVFTMIKGASQLQIDPDDKERAYVGTWGGGTFLTEDGGETWENMMSDDDSDALFSPTCIAIAPSNHDYVYTCDRTEAGVWANYDKGSWDGDGWMQRENFGDEYLMTSAIAVHPEYSEKMYVAVFMPPIAHGGNLFYLNLEAEGEYVSVGDDLPRSVLDIEIDPNNYDTLYATIHVHGLYKSEDAGTTWVQLDDQDTGLPRTGFFDVEVDDSDSNIVYATGLCGELPDYVMPQNLIPRLLMAVGVITNIDSAAECGVYKSEDAGDTWEHILETEGAGMNIAIHPDNNNLLFVADNNGGVWVSIDQGDTWRQENDGLGSLSVSGVKVQNNYVYVVTEGFGVYAGTVAMRSAVNRFTGNVIEKGSIIWDDSRSNNLVNEVYNIQLMVDPTDSSRIFASSYPGGMMRSDDQGETWHSKNFLLPSFRLNDPDTKGYYAFAMNPNDPENIVTCLFGKGCYMSYDGLDFNIPFSVGLENKDVYNVVFDSSGEYVYAGTNGGSAFRAKVELEEETRSNSVPTGLRRFAPSLTWWDSIKNLFW